MIQGGHGVFGSDPGNAQWNWDDFMLISSGDHGHHWEVMRAITVAVVDCLLIKWNSIPPYSVSFLTQSPVLFLHAQSPDRPAGLKDFLVSMASIKTTTKALKKLTLFPLIFLVYFEVSGGRFGEELAVQATGPCWPFWDSSSSIPRDNLPPGPVFYSQQLPWYQECGWKSGLK